MKLQSLVASKRLEEGLRPGDLQFLILNKVSIDQFEPKTGSDKEVLVMGLYSKDEEPAQDLARFIERGYIGVKDTEVSPGPDEDGNYMVFVEIQKDKETMKRVVEILNDIKSVTTVNEWQLNFQGGRTHMLSEDMIKQALRN